MGWINRIPENVSFSGHIGPFEKITSLEFCSSDESKVIDIIGGLTPRELMERQTPLRGEYGFLDLIYAYVGPVKYFINGTFNGGYVLQIVLKRGKIDGMNIINTTPHEITFLSSSDEVIKVPPCGYLINAKVIETEVGNKGKATLVKSQFIADDESENILSLIEEAYGDSDYVVVGSIIAAQAFPHRVFGMTPVSGYERVPLQEKRMNPLKFTTF